MDNCGWKMLLSGVSICLYFAVASDYLLIWIVATQIPHQDVFYWMKGNNQRKESLSGYAIRIKEHA
jgi:hypothetical protein